MGASISYLRHRLSTTTIPPFNDDRWIRRAGQILQWVAGQNNEFRQLASDIGVTVPFYHCAQIILTKNVGNMKVGIVESTLLSIECLAHQSHVTSYHNHSADAIINWIRFFCSRLW